MAEFKENVTYNNEDMEEIADWYQKSNEYYSNRIDNARRYLIALIQQMTVDDNAGNFHNFHQNDINGRNPSDYEDSSNSEVEDLD